MHAELVEDFSDFDGVVYHGADEGLDQCGGRVGWTDNWSKVGVDFFHGELDECHLGVLLCLEREVVAEKCQS